MKGAASLCLCLKVAPLQVTPCHNSGKTLMQTHGCPQRRQRRTASSLQHTAKAHGTHQSHLDSSTRQGDSHPPSPAHTHCSVCGSSPCTSRGGPASDPSQQRTLPAHQDLCNPHTATRSHDTNPLTLPIDPLTEHTDPLTRPIDSLTRHTDPQAS